LCQAVDSRLKPMPELTLTGGVRGQGGHSASQMVDVWEPVASAAFLGGFHGLINSNKGRAFQMGPTERILNVYWNKHTDSRLKF